MGHWFSKNKHDRTEGAHHATQNANVDDRDRALLDLKVQRDQLVTHRKKVNVQLGRDEEAARTLVQNGKKPQAMIALRKKKHHQQLAVQCEQHVAKVEELIDQIEAAQATKVVVEALKIGVATLKQVQREIGGADYVNKLMDERDEALEAQREISEALAGAGVSAEDEDALADLAKLEERIAEEKLLDAAVVASPPQAAAGTTAATQPGPGAVAALPVATGPAKVGLAAVATEEPVMATGAGLGTVAPPKDESKPNQLADFAAETPVTPIADMAAEAATEEPVKATGAGLETVEPAKDVSKPNELAVFAAETHLAPIADTPAEAVAPAAVAAAARPTPVAA